MSRMKGQLLGEAITLTTKRSRNQDTLCTSDHPTMGLHARVIMFATRLHAWVITARHAQARNGTAHGVQQL
eukprot:2061390-Rhodomonas_salina.1